LPEKNIKSSKDAQNNSIDFKSIKMNKSNKSRNNRSDISSDVHCISIESDHNQNDCISISSDDEEDSCEIANNHRKNGLQDYSKDCAQIINNEREQDHEIDAMIESILESRQLDSDYNDSNDSSDDSDFIVDEINDSDAKDWTRNVLLPPIEDEECLESGYNLGIYELINC